MSFSWKTLLVAGSWTVVTGAVLGAAVGLSACDLGETTPLPDGATDDFDGGFVPVPDASSTTGGGTGGGTTGGDASLAQGLARLAHMLQGFGAADFCWRPATGGAWLGPLIGGEGITYGQVSARFPISSAAAERPSNLQFAIVAAGAGCPGDAGAAALGADSSLAANGGLTVVAYGTTTPDAGPATQAARAIPDLLTASPTAVNIRAFHASQDTPPVEVAVGTTTLGTGIRYGTVSPFPYTSAAGFTAVPAPAPIPQGTTLSLKTGGLPLRFALPELAAGSIVTAFATGRSTPGAEPALQVIACFDGQFTPTRTECAALAPQ